MLAIPRWLVGEARKFFAVSIEAVCSDVLSTCWSLVTTVSPPSCVPAPWIACGAPFPCAK
jgi:hypothetical protein